MTTTVDVGGPRADEAVVGILRSYRRGIRRQRLCRRAEIEGLLRISHRRPEDIPPAESGIRD